MSGNTIDDLFQELTPFARALAAQVGCALDSKQPVLCECIDQPLSVKEDAEAATRRLSVGVAITYAADYGAANRFVESSGVKGLLGFAADGAPKLCVIRGIVSVELPGPGEALVAAYLGVTALYGLRPACQTDPCKPSGSWKRFPQP